MKHFFSFSENISRFSQRGALLLAIGATEPAAWGQSFGPVTTYSTGANSKPVGVALEDINGDGRLDIITSNRGTNNVGVLLGLATGGFAAVNTYATGGIYPDDIKLGDINRDGRLDIVVPNFSTNTVGVLMGLAGGAFAPAVTYSTGGVYGGPVAVALGDVNGDSQLDIVTVRYAAVGEVGVLLGRAGGSFAPVSTYPTGSAYPNNVKLGDLNGDGRLDIVSSCLSSNRLGILLALTSGGFAPAVSYPTTSAWTMGIALADLNGDGRLDIVSNNSSNIVGSTNIGVLLGLANGGFGPINIYPTSGNRSNGIVLGDINGDGQLDIITSDQSSSNAVLLLGIRGGSFAGASVYTTGTSNFPVNITLGDVNGDGRLDIVTANQTMNTVSVLLNTGTYTPLATARPSASDLSLAPNPAHDAFTVTLPADFRPTQAELLNALGQVVRRPAVGGPSFQVETSGLAPGLYTLRLQSGSGVLNKRVVVE